MAARVAPRIHAAFVWISLILFVAFLAAIDQAAHADVSTGEARMLWIVRDLVPVEPASVRDVMNAVVTNARTALSRSQFPEAIYIVILEGWTRLLGETIFAVRLLPAFFSLFIAAVIFRLLYKGLRLPRIRLKAAGLGILGLLILRIMTTSAGWLPAIMSLRMSRTPIEPAITDFDPASPAAYYDLHYGLRRGLALDLAWREPDPVLMEDYVRQLTHRTTPVWVMMPRSDAEAWDVFDMLETVNYAATTCIAVDNNLFVRLEYNPEQICNFP